MIILHNRTRRSAYHGDNIDLTVLVDGRIFKYDDYVDRLVYTPVNCVDRTFRSWLPYRWRVYDEDSWNQ